MKRRPNASAPQVNCSQLVPGNSMLLFIQSRATHPPCEFLYSDLDNSQVGPGSGDIFVTGSEDPFCMLFLGKDKEGEYGRIARWEDHEDEFVLPETIGGHGLAYKPTTIRALSCSATRSPNSLTASAMSI